MGTTYLKNKESYYLWISNNQEKYKANNRAQQIKRTAKITAWRRVSKMFRNILIDDLV